MSAPRKLAALDAIAALRRDTALQDLAVARGAEFAVFQSIAALTARRREAAAAADPTDMAASVQLDRYCLWAEAQLQSAKTRLVEAAKTSENCRRGAALALGRTEALDRLAQRLAAERRAKRTRSV
jgi:hypothetical protein